VLAGWLGLELGTYHQLSDSLHVYDKTADDFGGSLPGPVAENHDNLAVTKVVSDHAFGILERLVEGLIAENGCLEDLIGSWTEASLPHAYQNFARVLCAESARRRRRRDLAERLMEDCDNPAFTQLFAAWLTRIDSKALRS
jgi:thymidylate synthase